MMKTAHAMLLELLQTQALKKGDFTLKSGKQSNYLIDCKRVVLTAKGHKLVGKVMLESIFVSLPTAVAGVELGGCPLASAVSMASASTSSPIDAIYVRKERKGHGSKNWIEGRDFPQHTTVIILEDVTTTGGSALFAAAKLREYGFNVLGVCTLVDRDEGGREAVEKEGLQFWAIYTTKDFK